MVLVVAWVRVGLECWLEEVVGLRMRTLGCIPQEIEDRWMVRVMIPTLEMGEKMTRQVVGMSIRLLYPLGSVE